MARLASRAGCVLVSASNGAVHPHLPRYLVYRNGFGLRVGQQGRNRPSAGLTPQTEVLRVRWLTYGPSLIASTEDKSRSSTSLSLVSEGSGGSQYVRKAAEQVSAVPWP